MRLVAPSCVVTTSTTGSLKVQSATVVLDAGVAPYGQATVVCAAPDAATVATIDPRKHQRMTVTLDDHGDLFGGTATRRTLSLVLTRRLHDPVAGTLTLTGKTDEQLLIGQQLLAKTSKTWTATTVQGLVTKVLAALGRTCTFGAPDYAVDPAAVVQTPGQAYWDFLDGTLQGGNLRLWCDEAGQFHLDDKSTVQPGQLSLEYGVDLTQLSDDIDIESGAFYDGLVVRFSYTDGGGNPQTAYDYASNSATPAAVGLMEFHTPPAVAGTARRLLRRLSGRGRVLSQSAVARFDVRPGQSYVTTMPDGAPTQSGLVASVSWSYPDTLMAVTTRELSDTTGIMWAAQAAGISWASIPAGVRWTNYLAIGWATRPAGESWDSEPAGLRWSEYGNG